MMNRNDLPKLMNRCSAQPVSGTIILIEFPDCKCKAEAECSCKKPQEQAAPENGCQQVQTKHLKNECRAARKGFLNYVKNLDRTIFNLTCQKFPPGELKFMDSIIVNEASDLAQVMAFIDIFKEKVNETIMDEVVRLKGLMT